MFHCKIVLSIIVDIIGNESRGSAVERGGSSELEPPLSTTLARAARKGQSKHAHPAAPQLQRQPIINYRAETGHFAIA